MLLLALLLSFSQRLDYRHVYLRQQTADSVTVIASWAASNADSVRLQWGTGVTRMRAPRGRDSLRVARQATPSTVAVVMTPLRGAASGTPRSLTIAIPARPLPAPSIDSAALDTVRASAPAPVVEPSPITGPIAVPGPFTPNLPAGLVLVGDTEFDQPETPGLEVINWSGVTTQSPTTFGVARTTVDGRSVLRAWFPEQHAGDGVGPLTVTTGPLNARSHYMAVHMRYSANYVWHSNGEKLFYPVSANPQSGSGLANVHPQRLFVGLLQPYESSPPAEAITAPGVIPPPGEWFTAEFYVRYNSPGRADGTWQIWINGRQVMDRQAHQFFSGPTQAVIFRGRLDFTRGGGPSSVLTPIGGQWVDIDRVAFYAGR